MKTLVKCGLMVVFVGAALLFTAPKQAEARRYWAYYPSYGPVYTTAYYPRRVVYPRRVISYYGGPAYYGPVYYAPPGGYYGGCCCN